MRKVLVTLQNKGLLVSSNLLAIDDGTLPTGYTKLQYISASGSAATNTGILLTSTDVIKVKFKITNASATGDKMIVAVQAGYSGGGLHLETYGADNKWYARYGSTASVNTTPTSEELSEIIDIELKKGYFGVNGTRRLSPVYSSMPNTTLCIAGRIAASGTSVSYGARGDYYDVKIVSSDGVYKWWGIPAKNSNNVAGFYDLVSDKFFTSNTSTAFTAGPAST